MRAMTTSPVSTGLHKNILMSLISKWFVGMNSQIVTNPIMPVFVCALMMRIMESA